MEADDQIFHICWNTNEALPVRLLKWVSQSPSQPMTLPRYANLSTTSSSCPPILILGIPAWSLMCMIFDFSALMQSPTFSSQVRRWMLEVVSIFHQSSAKSRSVSQLIPSKVMPASGLTRAFFMMKLRAIRNRKGERMRPCLTPVSMVKRSVWPVFILMEQLGWQ